MKSLDKILQKSLNQILLDGNYVERRELRDAIKQSQREQIPIEDVLLKKELIEEERLAEAIAHQANLPFISLEGYDLSEDFVKNSNISPDTMHQHLFVPLDKIGDILTIVTASLPDQSLIESVTLQSQESLFLYIGTRSEVKSILHKLFPNVSVDASVKYEQESTIWQSIFDEADANIQEDLRKKHEQHIGAGSSPDITNQVEGAFSDIWGEEEEEEEEEIVQSPPKNPVGSETMERNAESIAAEVNDVFSNLFEEEEEEEEDHDSPRYQLQQLAERLKQNPADYSALNNYVDLALSIGELDLAVEQLVIFANNLDRAGDRDGAVNCYEYILQLDPENEKAKQYLAG